MNPKSGPMNESEGAVEFLQGAIFRNYFWYFVDEPTQMHFKVLSVFEIPRPGPDSKESFQL